METKRREILVKWFATFQLSIGLPNKPLTEITELQVVK